VRFDGWSVAFALALGVFAAAQHWGFSDLTAGSVRLQWGLPYTRYFGSGTGTKASTGRSWTIKQTVLEVVIVRG
jgi:hypothetical protein